MTYIFTIYLINPVTKGLSKLDTIYCKSKPSKEFAEGQIKMHHKLQSLIHRSFLKLHAVTHLHDSINNKHQTIDTYYS